MALVKALIADVDPRCLFFVGHVPVVSGRCLVVKVESHEMWMGTAERETADCRSIGRPVAMDAIRRISQEAQGRCYMPAFGEAASRRNFEIADDNFPFDTGHPGVEKEQT